MWTRTSGRKPERLTREAVVAAAVDLADREGLAAVSVRRIAAELQARPMSLYSFFERKDDLIDLMLDHVMGEMLVPGDLPEDWRAALLAVVHRQLKVGRKHLWMMGVLSERVQIGPSAARHAEQSHAAIAGLGLPPEQAVRLLRVVDTYLWGFATLGMQELAARQRDQLTEEEWRASTEAYFTELTAAGDLPRLAEVGRPGLLKGDPEAWIAVFDEGLTWILDGFEASLKKC